MLNTYSFKLIGIALGLLLLVYRGKQQYAALLGDVTSLNLNSH
jgi:hypothetical protein